MMWNRVGTAVGLLLLCSPVVAQETPGIEELWAIIQQQQAQIDGLRQQLDQTRGRLTDTGEQIEATQNMVAATGDYVESLNERISVSSDAGTGTSIGGYGELHYNALEARDANRDVDQIDFHRFVLFFGHEFNDRTRFFSELELEHSLAADGAPGEVELEQAYIDYALTNNVSVQSGLFLLPIGILNETHEPPTFYGVERNDVESVIIPSTWWEAGAGLSGNFANGFSWNFAIHSGLAMPTAGGSAFRVRSGRQKVAEALASDPAYTARLKYTGTPGLELSASFQYQSDPSQIPGDGLDSGRLFTAHMIYQTGPFALRVLYGAWSFDGAAVELAGADEQSGWFVEPSYRLSDKWGVYARYEDIEGARAQDEFTEWEAGLNYWLYPSVTLKFDYRSRDHTLVSEAGRDFDGVDLGIGYQF